MGKSVNASKTSNFKSSNKPEQSAEEKAQGSTAPVRPDLTNGQKIGAMLYYSDPKFTAEKVLIQFEHLDQENKDIWYTRGKLCVEAIGKLGLMLVPYVDPAVAQQARSRNVEILTGIVKGFNEHLVRSRSRVNNGKIVQRKSDMNIDLYPCEELAHQILNVG